MRGPANYKCPKCQGNVFFDRSVNYNYDKQQHERTGWCLQCGFTVYMRVIPVTSDTNGTHAAIK